MSKQSISTQLRRSSLTSKRAIVEHWAIAWWRQYEALLSQMGKAIASQDYEQLFWVAGRMKDLTDRKLQASTGIIQALAGHHTGLNHISNEPVALCRTSNTFWPPLILPDPQNSLYELTPVVSNTTNQHHVENEPTLLVDNNAQCLTPDLTTSEDTKKIGTKTKPRKTKIFSYITTGFSGVTLLLIGFITPIALVIHYLKPLHGWEFWFMCGVFFPILFTGYINIFRVIGLLDFPASASRKNVTHSCACPTRLCR